MFDLFHIHEISITLQASLTPSQSQPECFMFNVVTLNLGRGNCFGKFATKSEIQQSFSTRIKKKKRVGVVLSSQVLLHA